MSAVVVIVYFLLLSFVLLYSLSQLGLALDYRKKTPTVKPNLNQDFDKVVTVQLPVYNEKFVIDRLIDKVVEFDYPKELLEIQLLDDSTDETSDLIVEKIAQLKKEGFDINHITRKTNIDYKAGALKNGLEMCRGDFIAIFDADFLPEKDFLKTTIPYFENSEIGVVQTRWGHLNEDYSLLTKIQSFALNAHFTVEQVGRSLGGHFINFNGTAGIWRKDTIVNAGGWQGDTITEDLDLSYRAQLKGWKIKYLEGVVSPAELPPEINSLKSQQYRWAKGAAECARKNLPSVLKSKVSFGTKWHAFFHLTNSINWLSLLGGGILLVPFLHVSKSYFIGSPLWLIFCVFHISFISLFVFYWIGNKPVAFNTWKDKVRFVFHYPVFLTMSMGISFNTSMGVIKGYLRRSSPFVRTPKFNVLNHKKELSNRYVKIKLNWVNLIEILLFFYSVYGVYVTIKYESFLALPFILMQAIGFAVVSYSSFKWRLKS